VRENVNFKATKDKFKFNDKDIFIYSGEIHYFRIPKRLWSLHLKKLKEANCNTVSTYIPWSWHEYEDNKFDFTGKTHPQRDLVGFLDLCTELGLFVITKPGPYILAEYKLHGLPEWLFSKHPQIYARASDGKSHPAYISTYMHPIFLRYVKKWYKKVMPIIKDYQIANDKAIIMMQLCNEIAFYYWFSAEGDYSQACLRYYHTFLKKFYKNIKELNQGYGTDYKHFDEVVPPKGKATNKKGYIKYRDWHLFYRWYYARYLSYLFKEIKRYNINIPIFHNLPGWIEGRAIEYPVNIIMYDRLMDIAPDIMLGVDHIPEKVDFDNLSDDYICNEMTDAIQGRRFPILGIEIQSGSRHHKTRVYPDELELFYKACLIHGLKGMNLYMFSQGRNPERQGALGPVFYWQTPLSVDGKESQLYPVIKKIGRFIKTHGVNLINTKRLSNVCVGFYRPYYYTEFTMPVFGDRKIDIHKSGLDYDPKHIRDSILFDGILKTFKLLNQDFKMEDLQKVDLSTLCSYKQLWVVSLDFMDVETQRKLIGYVKRGGHLIIMPTLPDKDINLNKCKLLYNEFGIVRKSVEYPYPPKIDLLDVKDFLGLARVNIYEEGDGSEVIARTSDGKCCGLRRKIGKGNLTLLGTGFNYELEEHLKAYKRLLEADELNQYTYSANQDLITGQIFAEDYSYLYILNYHRNSKKTALILKGPKRDTELRIPANGTIDIPNTYGLIIPIDLRLDKDIRLKYTTSEILSIEKHKKGLTIEIVGHPQVKGEMVLEVKTKPKKISINGKSKRFRYKNKEILLSYHHLKNPLQIKVNS